MKNNNERMRQEGKDFRQRINLAHLDLNEGKFSYSQGEKKAFADAVGIPIELVGIDQKFGDLIMKQ